MSNLEELAIEVSKTNIFDLLDVPKERMQIYSYNERKKIFEPIPTHESLLPQHIKLNSIPEISKRLLTKDIIYFSDINEIKPPEKNLFLNNNIYSLLMCTIKHHHKLHGIVLCGKDKKGVWSKKDIISTKRISHILAYIFEHRYYQKTLPRLQKELYELKTKLFNLKYAFFDSLEVNTFRFELKKYLDIIDMNSGFILAWHQSNPGALPENLIKNLTRITTNVKKAHTLMEYRETELFPEAGTTKHNIASSLHSELNYVITNLEQYLHKYNIAVKDSIDEKISIQENPLRIRRLIFNLFLVVASLITNIPTSKRTISVASWQRGEFIYLHLTVPQPIIYHGGTITPRILLKSNILEDRLKITTEYMLNLLKRNKGYFKIITRNNTKFIIKIPKGDFIRYKCID